MSWKISKFSTAEENMAGKQAMRMAEKDGMVYKLVMHKDNKLVGMKLHQWDETQEQKRVRGKVKNETDLW
jgi:hypothetical protein